jgi:zinc resistance-associated protein
MAFTMVGAISLSRGGIGMTSAYAQDAVVTSSKIAQLHAVLRLTPAQQRLWGPVEAALRALSHGLGATEATDDDGLVHRVRARVTGMALDAVAVRRVISAAQPLIASLDDDQKRDGMNFIHAMGVSSVF